jgi:hypothetical protein
MAHVRFPRREGELEGAPANDSSARLWRSGTRVVRQCDVTSTSEQVFVSPTPLPNAPKRCGLRALPSWVLLATLVSLVACGRKATVEDCEQIVRRIAELELSSVVPKESLGAEVRDAEQSFRERALADCVGRRISQSSLACVASAKTAEAVIDDCFD